MPSLSTTWRTLWRRVVEISLKPSSWARRSYALVPSDSTITDTLGWLEHLAHLDAALKLDPAYAERDNVRTLLETLRKGQRRVQRPRGSSDNPDR